MPLERSVGPAGVESVPSLPLIFSQPPALLLFPLLLLLIAECRGLSFLLEFKLLEGTSYDLFNSKIIDCHTVGLH